MDEVDASIRIALTDPSLYLDKDIWFKLLQDSGLEMSMKDKVEWNKKLLKRKANNIVIGNSFYPDLYKIAKNFQQITKAHNEVHFSEMSAHNLNSIHDIGKWIWQRRKKCVRADIHGTTDAEFLDLTRSATY